MMLPVLVMGAALAAGPELVAGPVETVAEGFEFTEGPVCLQTGELVFSDIPADTIYKGDKSVFRKPSGKSNGLTLDREGRLLACEHWNRRVTRTERDGSVTVLADAFEGKRLNSPNDIVVRSDGLIFFTDPPYGLEGRPAELEFCGVYALAPDGRLTVLEKGLGHPNGLAFSPDEGTLYVGDSEAGFIRAYAVGRDGRLSEGREFCRVPTPDGIKVDREGRVWSTSSDGVRVYAPDGTHLGTVAVPHPPANCAFGEKDGKTLFITARTGVYRVRCLVEGIRPGPR